MIKWSKHRFNLKSISNTLIIGAISESSLFLFLEFKENSLNSLILLIKTSFFSKIYDFSFWNIRSVLIPPTEYPL